jgi:UDP-N-acetylenolpyruvoylglucosamine reductase
MENFKLSHRDQRMFVIGVGVNVVLMQAIVEMVIMHKKFLFNI